MEATLYFPYANGDPTRDYRYRGKEISAKDYAKLIETDYNSKKQGVDDMMYTRFSDNMSINPFEKRRINVKKVSYSFFECPCQLKTPIKPVRDMDISELVNTAADSRKKLMVLFMLDKEYVDDQPDLTIELNSWLKQSSKILNEPRLSKEEKILHLPKKDLQIYVGNQAFTLKDCKIMETKNTIRNFVVLVNSVYVGKDMLRIREAAAKVN